MKMIANKQGFSLIELMIALVIIGVLAAIAIPNYQNHLLKARRTDAINAVLDMGARQERFMSINNVYTSTAAQLGYTTLPISISASGNSFYELSVTIGPNKDTYVARATPLGRQTKDTDCYTYTIDNTGKKSNISSTNAVLTGKCW